MSVYLVTGTIEDGEKGIPFDVGVFTTLVKAQEAVRSIREKSADPETWVKANGQYFHYSLDITPMTLDQVQLPKEFQ